MAPFPRLHLLALLAAVGCYLLAGCILADLHFTASPVPPWVDLHVQGLVDDRPITQTSFPGSTQPAANLTPETIPR